MCEERFTGDSAKPGPCRSLPHHTVHRQTSNPTPREEHDHQVHTPAFDISVVLFCLKQYEQLYLFFAECGFFLLNQAGKNFFVSSIFKIA